MIRLKIKDRDGSEGKDDLVLDLADSRRFGKKGRRLR